MLSCPHGGDRASGPPAPRPPSPSTPPRSRNAAVPTAETGTAAASAIAGKAEVLAFPPSHHERSEALGCLHDGELGEARPVVVEHPRQIQNAWLPTQARLGG